MALQIQQAAARVQQCLEDPLICAPFPEEITIMFVQFLVIPYETMQVFRSKDTNGKIVQSVQFFAVRKRCIL